MTATLERTATARGTHHELRVDGQPFVIFGAQVHNSSAAVSRLPGIWRQLHALGANTAEIPVYWEQLEPSPGHFDFSLVDTIVRSARNEGLRVVLLWFGTWKNGVCDYVPRWIKQAPDRFPLMRDRAGATVRVLSPHCAASREADARAFAALMRHLKEIDENDGTVIMVQVENEPGSLFLDRDHGPAAEEAYAAGVPGELRTALGLTAADWDGAFPGRGAEAFNAWHIARYVEQVAAAGRAEYSVPLSVNVWLKERKGFMRPGVEYPSGVPVSHLLDLWKCAAPSIDLIAPDIYVMDYVGYREVCAQYRREDNPLFIPETGGTAPFAGYLFYALGDFGAIGWAPFGIDRTQDADALREELEPVANSFRLLRPAAGEIVRLQRSGSLHAAVEQQYLTNQLLTLQQYEVLVEFGRLNFGYGGLSAAGTSKQSGRALVGERGAHEFFVAGFDARVSFRARHPSQDGIQFLIVEEGRFEADRWVCERRINGDQTFFGLHLPAAGASYRVELQPLPPGT